MSNMSYCRFHNTLGDLRDCLSAITDNDLSLAERKCRMKLVRVCAEIVEEYEAADMLESDKNPKDDDEPGGDDE